jgi:hypothetical protein
MNRGDLGAGGIGEQDWRAIGHANGNGHTVVV